MPWVAQPLASARQNRTTIVAITSHTYPSRDPPARLVLPSCLVLLAFLLLQRLRFLLLPVFVTFLGSSFFGPKQPFLSGCYRPFYGLVDGDCLH